MAIQTAAVGDSLVSLGRALEALGGGTAPAAAAPAQPAPAPVDQFQAAPAAAQPAPAGGGTDNLQQLMGGLVQLLQSLVKLLGGGNAGAGQGAPADPNAAATAAGAGAAAPAAPASTADAAAAAAAAATAQAPGAAAASSSAGSGSPDDVAAKVASGELQRGSPEAEAAGLDPLMFDLNGTGAGFDTKSKVGANLNGQGAEQVNDLKSGTGLLTFDATPKDGAATQFDANKGKLSSTFGNKTDLTAYGIKGDQKDGSFSNGFAALRAAGEHFGMIRPGKQYLDGNDLKQLESKIGLKMQTGGLNGQSKSLADLGISRIDLGGATQTKAQGARDANGNVTQQQAGAQFTINGQQRGYVDGWFRADGKAAA
jgi:hypothetical protein